MLKYLLFLPALINLSLAVEQTATVPSGLVAAAQQEPLAFGMSLADASVPNGLEAYTSVQAPAHIPDFDLSKQTTVPIGQVVDAFNLHHADYRASLVDGVVVVRPAGKRVAYLDAQAKIQPIAVTGLMDAMDTIFAGLSPRRAAPAAKAGSSINLPSTESGDFQSVSLDGREGSVVGVLNQLAKQSGHGWFVATSDDNGSPRVRSFGIIHRHGSMTRVDVD